MTTLIRHPGSRRTMVGYCWPWTVRPGQKVDFMVSSEKEQSYRADLVRIICADSLSSPAMFKERELQASFSGKYRARHQSTPLGSYVEIAPQDRIDQLSSFNVQVMVCPTLLQGGVRVRAGGITLSQERHLLDDQHLVSRWNTQTQCGWSLLIDSMGRPVFMIGFGGSLYRAVLDRALVQDKWFMVSGGVDQAAGRIHVGAKAAGRARADLVSWPDLCCSLSYPKDEVIPQTGPLRFAACTDGSTIGFALKPAQCFNGRLDRVRLTEGVLSIQEALELSGTSIPEVWSPRVIGFWDFSRGMDQIHVEDSSGNALHGTTINGPMRAVRGVDWDGAATDWRERPEHYSAIHFHEDDLYDAQWQTDFSYVIPDDLPSGIYAARLSQAGSEDYVPFFVAPARYQARAPVALLLPTLTYTAYTNITGLTTFKRKRRIENECGESQLVEMDAHPCVLQSEADAEFLLENHGKFGKSLYSNHTDGTLRACASQRHPNMTIKPKAMNWTLVADTYITDWLEHKNIDYDLITDDLLHEEGVDLLKDYAVVLTGNHPEYCTARMLDAVDQYQSQGGRWMYLGGNGFYWVTSKHSQLPGMIEVRKDNLAYSGYFQRFELRHAFDGAPGGLWRDVGRPPQQWTGVGFDETGVAFQEGAQYKRMSDSYSPRAEFIFEGVSSESFGGYGVFGGGAAGQEMDVMSSERGTPAHALHLARADSFVEGAHPEGPVADLASFNAKGPAADMVFFETSGGGAVFSVGSMSWVGALSHNGYDNDVSRITENVLRRFRIGAPFRLDEIPLRPTNGPLSE